MPMKLPVALPLVCLSLVGCRSPFDGTWLFQWDLASVDVQSNCDLEGETVQTRGDDYEWIDIYTTAGGALVLTNGSQEYVGTWSGDTLDVEATYGEQTASTYMSWNDTIEASLSDKDLTGDRTLQEIDGDATTECRTQTKSDFEGVRMKGSSGADRTIGTQSSQSASTN